APARAGRPIAALDTRPRPGGTAAPSRPARRRGTPPRRTGRPRRAARAGRGPAGRRAGGSPRSGRTATATPADAGPAPAPPRSAGQPTRPAPAAGVAPSGSWSTSPSLRGRLVVVRAGEAVGQGVEVAAHQRPRRRRRPAVVAGVPLAGQLDDQV